MAFSVAFVAWMFTMAVAEGAHSLVQPLLRLSPLLPVVIFLVQCVYGGLVYLVLTRFMSGIS